MLVSYCPPQPVRWPANEWDGIAGWGREKQLHLVLHVWLSGLGWAWKSIRCDWYNLSHLKSSCGDCCHVPTLEWNNVPRGPALHPNAFVTHWACMRHVCLDTCTVPCGLLIHIGMLSSLGQAEAKIGKTDVKRQTVATKWRRRLSDRDRQKDMEG